MGRVVAHDRRVQTLRAGQAAKRPPERSCRDADARGLLGGQIRPGIGVASRRDQQMAEHRRRLEQRRHMERDDQLGVPDQSSGDPHLAGQLAADVALGHLPTLAQRLSSSPPQS